MPSNTDYGAPPVDPSPTSPFPESEIYSPEYPHYPPYSPRDKSSFAYETVAKRWPIILTQVIDAIYRASDEGEYAEKEREDEGKELIKQVGALKYSMSRNAVMPPIPEDGGANVELYNNMLSFLSHTHQSTWFTAPWLYAECYLYRCLRTIFFLSTHWKAFDPFKEQKERAWKGTAKGVYDLAEMMYKLEGEREELRGNEKALEVLVSDMIQMCLWGNTVDLSLLTSLDAEHLAKLQEVGGAAKTARAAQILRNDTPQVWEHIRTLKGARLDIVLDNSGFELFTDMVLADFLVTYTPYFSSVVFHPKTIPWFVSDVMPADFSVLLASLTTPDYFGDPPTPEHPKYLTSLATRWREYVSTGVFKLSFPGEKAEGEMMGLSVPEGGADWWVGPGVFGLMEEDEQGERALNTLRGSGLVVFKGDLNYRKLTADVRWPPSTPFALALGPLAGKFPLLSLRTSKADVIVGLREGQAEEMQAKEKDWRWNGKWGLVSFCAQGETGR